MATGRTYGGASPEERAATRRRQLVEAGLELFGTAGYRRTTVRQLCREARISDRNFYDDFSSPADLLLAVYHHCLDQLERVVGEALVGLEDDVETLAHAGLDAFFAALEADPRLARVVWFEVLGVSPEVEAAYLDRTFRFGELLVQLLDDRDLLGAMAREDRDIVVSALVGGISQVALNWVYAGYRPPRPQLIRPLVAVLLAGSEISLPRR